MLAIHYPPLKRLAVSANVSKTNVLRTNLRKTRTALTIGSREAWYTETCVPVRFFLAKYGVYARNTAAFVNICKHISTLFPDYS